MGCAEQKINQMLLAIVINAGITVFFAIASVLLWRWIIPMYKSDDPLEAFIGVWVTIPALVCTGCFVMALDHLIRCF